MASKVWPVLDVLLIIAGIFLGRTLAPRLKDDQRKIVSGIALLVGVVLIIYGITSVRSVSSQIMKEQGMPDALRRGSHLPTHLSGVQL